MSKLPCSRAFIAPASSSSHRPDKEQRQQNMRKAVLDSWAQSKLLLRQLAQQRAATIKDYLVEHGGLYDERVYLIDANLGEPEADGRVLTTLHLDSQ